MKSSIITDYSTMISKKGEMMLLLFIDHLDGKEVVNKQLVGITEAEALQMTDLRKTFRLLDEDVDFTPADYCYPTSEFMHDNFNSILGSHIRRMYKLERLTKQQYIDFCVAHLKEYYYSTYNNPNCILRSFFNNYVPDEIREKYDDCFAMLTAHEADIAASDAKFEWKKIPGKVIGFYHDSYYDKTRPITSRVDYIKEYSCCDRLRICLEMELTDNINQ